MSEAEREVLSWLDPSREPRIEWSRYVSRSALQDVEGGEATIDAWDGSIGEVPWSTLPDVGLAVMASTRGIDGIGVPGQTPEQTIQGQAQPDAVSPDRERIFAVFDPNTGERQVAFSRALVRTWHGGPASEAIAALDALPALRYRLDARQRRTPPATGTPWPSETPRPEPTAAPGRVRLTWANMPPELAPTFRAYPLAPGSSWTWRVTHHRNDVLWTAEIITETVDAAWLEGGEAIVRSQLDVRRLTPARNGGHTAGPMYRYVSPRMILRRPGGADAYATAMPGYPLDEMTACIAPDSPFGQRRVAPELFHEPFLRDIADEPSTACVREGPTTITTPAGSFSGCWRLDINGGAAWGSVRWFCPGVGPVADSLGEAATYHSQTMTSNLLRWRRAVLPER